MSMFARIFRENVGIKIAAIVLSLLVFSYVRAQKEGELTSRVSVELKGIPDSLAWTGEVPSQVSVTFSGKLRNLIELRIAPLRIPVDLSQAGPGRFQRTLSAADVPLPEVSGVVVTHFAGPERIDIVIEKRISKAVRVIPVLVGDLAEGLGLTAQPVALPESVSVNGAASVVASTDSLLTAPIDVSQKRQSFSTKVRLDLQGKALKCDAQVVEVYVEVGAESLGVVGEVPEPGSQR
ncbi:MAG: CdaR family protein [Candidatus Eisenbacteria bacterium]|nr:CdaR family protein [Candidatus Eisenbacteria bacterium]